MFRQGDGLMAFFFSDNPIALFLALVLVVVLLRIVLGQHKWFEGKNAAYVTLVIIAVIILLIAYRPLLSMISFGLPFLVLLIMLLFALGAMYFVLGMPKDNIWPTLKSIGILKTALLIAIVCIIAFAGSQVYGDRLLEDPKFSIADAMMPEEKAVEVNFAPVFTKQG
jgi:hypothetical protein